MRITNPELFNNAELQLSTAIELLEQKQSDVHKCAYINSCVRIQKGKSKTHKVRLDTNEDSLVLKLSILSLDKEGIPRKDAKGKLIQRTHRERVDRLRSNRQLRRQKTHRQTCRVLQQAKSRKRFQTVRRIVRE